ncbi:2OG-Fe(II) oxygenase family protein [Microbulbifer variabilis]|uniref:2OG-Fe(II) oxygenase family protein n=1 Tax=Microbulbifer variabilis TaxID=266805 RepID=UPI001CFEEDCC|nr:2OG-Fe(II) oxygenase family protein [Microbulbifer variabilis]
MPYKINNEIDLLFWRNKFSSDLKCRVSNLLNLDSAHLIKSKIQNYAEFKQAHIAGKQYSEISKEEFKQLEANERLSLIKSVHKQASNGVGFWYGRQGLNQNSPTHLASIYNLLSSEEMMSNVREITGISSLAYLSAQLTAFAPGDFITRHKDDVSSEKRRVAFVYNLSENWHPDWGGLLQFYKNDGSPTESWTPQYNSLCLFDVKHIHSVTCVAPFAPKLRIAISGWFHDR